MEAKVYQVQIVNVPALTQAKVIDLEKLLEDQCVM